MSDNLYQFYCDNCNFRKICKANEDFGLIEIPQSPIMKKPPYIDNVVKKTVATKTMNRTRAFKCPKCGFTFRAKKLESQENKNEQTDYNDGRETGFKG
jgi:hypothetical protein